MNSVFLEYLISWAQRINLKNYMKLIHQADTGFKKGLTCKQDIFGPEKKFEVYLFHFPNGTQGTYK